MASGRRPLATIAKLLSTDYAKKYYPQITQITQISKKNKNCK